VFRTTAAVLVLVACALVPVAAGAKPDYTATCNANTHDLTLTWTGGTDVTATTALLEWANGAEETVNLVLPHGGQRTYTFTSLGTQSGPLAGVEVQFSRHNSSLPDLLRVSCS
jgi:hypothetical protein